MCALPPYKSWRESLELPGGPSMAKSGASGSLGLWAPRNGQAGGEGSQDSMRPISEKPLENSQVESSPPSLAPSCSSPLSPANPVGSQGKSSPHLKPLLNSRHICLDPFCGFPLCPNPLTCPGIPVGQLWHKPCCGRPCRLAGNALSCPHPTLCSPPPQRDHCLQDPTPAPHLLRPCSGLETFPV